MFVRLALVLVALAATVDLTSARTLTPDAVNNAAYAGPPQNEPSAVMLRTQVMLDRLRFSPGVIDAHPGENTSAALRALQDHAGLEASGRLDEPTWQWLVKASPQPVLTEYRITKDDAAGPFTATIPTRLEAQAKLDRLGYTGPAEHLAEKFHMDEDLLRSINPNVQFDKAGETIVVANVARPAKRKTGPSGGETVGRSSDTGDDQAGPVARLVIDKRKGSLRAIRKDGRTAAFYPATVGSAENPAPSGTYEVARVARDPTYHYRPSLNFEGVDSEKPFTVPAGPNNPVGLVWIELTKDGYGIHGTPEPAKIGKTASHGCVRLTNWDALQLAEMIKKGVPVEFRE